MKICRTFRKLLALGLVGLLSTSCDIDPFSLAWRRISGPYFLHQFESGSYYVDKEVGWSFEEDEGGGVLDGTVDLIGWNENYIVAKRYSTFRGDPDGWMIIDVHAQSVAGPFSEGEMNQKHEIAGITAAKPEEAWNTL